jgi:hypothetical protein
VELQNMQEVGCQAPWPFKSLNVEILYLITAHSLAEGRWPFSNNVTEIKKIQG